MVAVGFLIFPIVSHRGRDHGQTQEQSDIRQLCLVIKTYTEQNNTFPENIESAMKDFQFSEPRFYDLIKEEYFKYTRPANKPKKTNPYTIIIEYMKDGRTYRGQVDGHVTIGEKT